MEENIKNAIQKIKSAILQSQYLASKGTNQIQLSLYYGIGKYISLNSRKGFWGKGAIKTISENLRKEMPGLRGFGESNIKYMRNFYEQWFERIESTDMLAEIENRQTVSGEIVNRMANPNDIDITILAKINRQTVSGDLNDFLSIGFSQHNLILSTSKDLDERLFYIHQTAVNHWSYRNLLPHIKADDYHHQATLPNNFELNIKDPRQAIKAIRTFKDEYLLDFINTEELGIRDEEDVDEKVIENGIVHNIKQFIMMFGRGFAFIGNQYHLTEGGEDFYIDLLFFCRELGCLVALELKSGKFKPAYLGQLDFYLQLLDRQVKLPSENPSIGLVLCKEANRTIAEVAVRDYNKPMGVATYRTKADMPEKLRNALPDIDELKKLMDDK